MGRKIPGKKHRGVKDPYAQHAKRLATLKTVINRTPVDPDSQPIPRSLKQLMSWKDKGNSATHKSKLSGGKVGKIQKKDSFVSRNPVSKLKKIQGESNRSFNLRINNAMKSLKGGQNIGFDDINELPPDNQKRERTEDTPYIQKKGKNKQKRRMNSDEPILSKSQKRTLKEKTKKEQLKEERELNNFYTVHKDTFKFGETVHEPPTLTKPRKADKNTGVSRPARKDLLLNQLFDKKPALPLHHNQSKKANITVNLKKPEGVVDMKGKRKDLPDKVRRRLEQSQKEAIEAYKLLKLERMKKEKLIV